MKEFTPINDLNRIVGGKLFVPISLGNHYYSLGILRQLLVEFVSKSELSIVFLCDRLRFLSYQIRGETNIKRINSNIKIQLDQMSRVLANLGIKDYKNVVVANWSLIQDDPRFCNLLASLEKVVIADAEVDGEMHKYCTKLMHRFYGFVGTGYDEGMKLQRQYVMEETALSLFMTEVYGHNLEVYRRGLGFVDYLYSDRPTTLTLITGKSQLNRRFIAIEDWLRPENQDPSRKRLPS